MKSLKRTNANSIYILVNVRLSLYQRLKASQTSTQEEGNLIKTSQTSHARARRRGVKQLFSYKCDIRATSTPVKENKSPSHAQVTNGTLSESVRPSSVMHEFLR